MVRGAALAVVPDAADTVTAPCLTAVSRPMELIVAMAVFDVAQVTLLIGFEEPSE
jgi:hypothetical protein